MADTPKTKQRPTGERMGILRRLRGLEIPAGALRDQPDGTTTVELLTVHGPETRAVTLIYRDEDLALCAPEDLTPGSTVIIG